MRARLVLLLCALLFVAAVANAVELSIGYAGYPSQPDADDFDLGIPRTAIDIGGPASATGVITVARFEWSLAPCAAAAKVKFFRRFGDTLSMIAERGPFDITSSAVLVDIDPPVPVEQGDLIGITQTAPCGNLRVASPGWPDGFLEYASDITGSVPIAAATRTSGSRLALAGSGVATEQLAGVIPIVGSAIGNFGSNFKTSLQLAFGSPNSSDTTTGRLVFHPAGTPGSSADPSLPFSFASGHVVSFPDVVAAMGQTGKVGSLDIVVPAGSRLPVVIARVFNDAGADGTSGLTEPAVTGGPLSPGIVGYLITPHDLQKTRFNVGVRTLHSGAVIQTRLLDSNGNVVAGTYVRSYPATWFIQLDVSEFLAGAPVSDNQIIEITVLKGSAIVYGSTTDNITNDPNIQYVTIVYAQA